MITEQNYQTVYEKFHRPVFHYTLKLCRDENVAETITADALSVLLEKIASGQEIQNARAYLYTIAYHKVVDHSRQNHRLAPLEVAMNDPDQAIGPEVMSDLRNLQPWMKEHLTEKQYQVISLRFFDGLSITEIAEITNKNYGNVKTMIHRARKQIVNDYLVGNTATRNKEAKRKPEKRPIKTGLLRDALNSKLTYGDRFDWQLTENQFLAAYGYPKQMTGAAEQFFRRYHKQLVRLAQDEGLITGETCI